MLLSNVSDQTCRIWGSVVVVTSFLFFSIGLNLQYVFTFFLGLENISVSRRLVMIHKIDGTRMEKYYIGGSLFLATPVRSHGLPIRSNNGMHQVMFLLKMSAISGNRDGSIRKPLGYKQYRNIVLRIALYPFSSLTTLGVMSIGILTVVAKGLNDQLNWRLLLTLRVVYLARGTTYGVVAASDPAITHDLKVLYRHYAPRRTYPSGDGNISTRPVATHDSPDFELQESTTPGNQPAVARVSSHTTVDAGNGFRIEDNVGYSFSELRHFFYEVLDGTLSEFLNPCETSILLATVYIVTTTTANYISAVTFLRQEGIQSLSKHINVQLYHLGLQEVSSSPLAY
ncbi:hypothetical protein L218DRAFT_950762 [Marasmius fiardii PR-910]|nr:hypothetical protein L218DRAFT_950762 [Marasmius fiardii PR-910]